ncbi:MAG: hypothetical protein A2V98_17945 [Planctomycetes bacterium RBG_16_64_12]|nr:MAG: hypothetical protein A2V98_17945 [Planctomycetes bacterium RBG_16_64_12]
MLEETPVWTFRSKRPLTRWYEHVHLLPNRVVGYWFCLDRSSGARLWERRLEPDEIVGIDDGVIVANERWRRLDFGSTRHGCYGISLETGKLLWTSHASGFWSWLLGELDHRSRDCPVYVADGRCYCRSGRILDVATGRLVERVSKDEIKPPEKLETETETLRRSKHLSDPVKLKVGDGLWLSHKLAAKPEVEPLDDEFLASVWEFRLFLTDDEGRVRWEFDLKDTGYETYYYGEKCRYSAPYLYLLACEKRTTKKWKKIEVYNPTQFHLLTLDLSNGRIVQDIQVTRNPVDVCRFEDIDEQGVLLSGGDNLLHYFRIAQRHPTIQEE